MVYADEFELDKASLTPLLNFALAYRVRHIITLIHAYESDLEKRFPEISSEVTRILTKIGYLAPAVQKTIVSLLTQVFDYTYFF